jgi:hypothetical protein
MTDNNTELEVAPALEIDFGIGRVYVQGDSDTTFAEVVEEFNEQKEDMTESIETLKEFDYELRDKYDTDSSISSPSFS